MMPSLGVSSSLRAPPAKDHLFGTSIPCLFYLCKSRISFSGFIKIILTLSMKNIKRIKYIKLLIRSYITQNPSDFASLCSPLSVVGRHKQEFNIKTLSQYFS